MREIKFSILLQHEETGHIIEKIYSYLQVFNGTCKTELKAINRYYVIAKRQYTGLKDKNGKEIFEGDLIKGGMTGCPERKSEVSEEVKMGWMNDSDGYNAESYYCWTANGDSLDDLIDLGEVIGNIYESPGLI